MKVYEIILLAVGVVLTLCGYIYSKVKAGSKKVKIPEEYLECIGICKKHNEKDGKFTAQYEIMHDGKTLKYETPAEESEDKLKAVDAIEKFYVNDDKPKDIKTASDFGGTKELDDKTKKICYTVMGIGLACIIITLFMVLS